MSVVHSLLPYVALTLGLLGLLALSRGAVFAPSGFSAVQRMISLLAVRPGDVAADLGSGDGRIVIALARAGAEAHGFEHNPLLVWWSRYRARRAGFARRASIHRRNFWRENLSRFSVIVIFGIPYVMPRLEKKLAREARAGTRIVSYLFPLPTWKPAACDGGVYLYVAAETKRAGAPAVLPRRSR